MRGAKLDITLVHYRGAVTACSLTRQLAGVLPLLEEMRDRGIAADVATYNAAISACTTKNVRSICNVPDFPGFFVIAFLFCCSEIYVVVLLPSSYVI